MVHASFGTNQCSQGYKIFTCIELTENMQSGSHIPSTISCGVVGESCHVNSELTKSSIVREQCLQELKLLDLYAGCGGMSTGLCLGARLSNVNLVTVSFNLVHFYLFWNLLN